MASSAHSLGPTPSARVAYERALLMLCTRGRIPGVKLSPLQFRVLCFALSQGPGFVMKQHKIAAELECSRLQVWRALKTLRRLGLVLAELIPGHKPLPWTRNGQPIYTRTKVCRYWVRIEALRVPLESEQPGGSLEKPSTRQIEKDETTPTPTPSRGGRQERREQDPHGAPRRRVESETPPSADASSARDTSPATDDAVREHQGGRSTSRATVAPELERLARAWDALNLRDQRGPSRAGARERGALGARRAEGCTLAELEDAIAGAGANEWLRKGRAGSAFAIVFANTCSVRRFAAEGRPLRPKADAVSLGDMLGVGFGAPPKGGGQ
jgi:hypothetical protein